MLDRIAITASLARMLCAALCMLLFARSDLFATAVVWTPPSIGQASASVVRCTHSALRTRSSGLHQRFLMREQITKRPLLTLDE